MIGTLNMSTGQNERSEGEPEAKATDATPSDIFGYRRAMREANKVHAFWDKQPVPRLGERVDEQNIGSIETAKGVAAVRAEPLSLPAGYGWVTCDIFDESQLKEIYTLLCENYVEDDDNMFRFDYSTNFLLWALAPPGFYSNWHVGVRATEGSKKLVGFITGIPGTVCVMGKELPVAEINFLCVHKKLRSKRLAPVLIREVTRRVHLENRWHAVYTAGVELPKPVVNSRYHHRSINVKKLVDVGFSHVSERLTLQRAERINRLPDKITHPLKPMEQRHVASVTGLIRKKFDELEQKLFPIFSEEEVAHWLLPRDGVVYSYVIEATDRPDEVTDVVSFYVLPSTIISHPRYNSVKAAYSFYNVATSLPLTALVQDALVVAKQMDFDVFNALDTGRNGEFLKDLKFGIGDGTLRFYLYNYRCVEIEPSEVGLIML
eukprot:Polyplicarium_translucidae@DN2075_c0_g1_i3.p1